MNNDDIFREIADQLRPSPEVRADLLARIDAEPAGSEASGNGPADPTPAAPEAPPAAWAQPVALAPVRRRRRFPAWGAAVAAVAAVALVVSAPGLLGRQAGMIDLSPADAGTQAPLPQPTKAPLPELTKAPPAEPDASDYTEIYAAVLAGLKPKDSGGWFDSWGWPFGGFASGIEDHDVAQPAAPSAEQGGTWDTNVQVDGIDEGDVVKSDGRTIFVAAESTIRLVTADGAGSRQLSQIDTRDQAVASTDGTLQGPVTDLMLHGTTLVALVTDFTPQMTRGLFGPRPDAYLPYVAKETKALLYDVSDPAAPRFLTSFGQSGQAVTSRLSGDVLYLVTRYDITDRDTVKAEDPWTFVPQVEDSSGRAALPASDIELLPEPQGASYTVASSIDLRRHARIDSQSVLGAADSVYLTQDNLYLASTTYSGQAISVDGDDRVPEFTGFDTRTDLTRIALKDGVLTAQASGSVPGEIVNQFALDEHEGFLRIAVTLTGTTSSGWTSGPALYVLDQGLKTVSVLPELAPGETIESVRFAGDVAYVVSFVQVDPLFAIDLSDPTRPSVMSELKIPGFSTYLHPWSDGLLLGLGRDGDAGGWINGMKLSMFDTSDPFAVTEAATLAVPFDEAAVLSNHKAVFIDKERSLIGFAAASHSGSQDLHYLLYRWDGTAFSLVEDLPVADVWPTSAGQSLTETVRGLTIGGHLYVASSAGVDVYDVDTVVDGSAVKVAAPRFGG